MAPESIRVLNGWRVQAAGRGEEFRSSLVIATYRRAAELRRLLEALSTIGGAPGEVAVVDGAGDETFSRQLLDWAHSRPLPFDLVYAASPRGLTRQRNVGIDLTRGRYVHFLDDDTVPLAGYFGRMEEVFESDPECTIGAAGGCVLTEIDKPMVGRWRLRYALGIAPRSGPLMFHPSGSQAPLGLMRRFTGLRDVDLFPGCAFAVRRRVLDCTRFSEFFDGYSQGEDTEMALRIRRQWRVVCCGDAPILHFPSPSGRPPGFEQGSMDVRNRVFIAERHAPQRRLRHRVQLWVDFVFLVLMDLAWTLRRPWRPYHLSHAAGLLWGAARCLWSPPRLDEPPAHRAFALGEQAVL